MADWEEFDTWEPTHDYPSAPQAKSAKIGRSPGRRPVPAEWGGPGEDKGAGSGSDQRGSGGGVSFLQEFSAAAEQADKAQAEQTPRLPYVDSPGIAALLANAENILGSDGPEVIDEIYRDPAAGLDEPPEAMRGDYGQAASGRLRRAGRPGALPGAQTDADSDPDSDAEDFPDSQPPSGPVARVLANRKRAAQRNARAAATSAAAATTASRQNVNAAAATSAAPAANAALAQPQHSEGWKSLIDGWNEQPALAGETETFDGTAAAGLDPGDRPATQAMLESLGEDYVRARGEVLDSGVPGTGAVRGEGAGAGAFLPVHRGRGEVRGEGRGEDSAAAAGRRNLPAALGAAGAPGAPSETRLVAVHTAQDGSKVKVRRVGTSPAPVVREGISPVVALAAVVVLALISLGVGVGVGMNIAPQPTVTPSASPTEYPEDPNSPDSVSNVDPTPSASASSSASPSAAAQTGLQGLKIALDPGHNGGNAAAWQQIGQNVPDGRGGFKSCDTPGTATNDGFAENEFNWRVASLLKAKLEAAGATVFLTRDSNTGVGPCVNERGTFGQKVGADVMVSIHGNGTTDTSVHGFFAMISDPPLNASQGVPSLKLAQKLIDAMSQGGFSPQSNGPIQNGLWKRSDLAGLNLQEVPDVMMELGEMRNPSDAAMMKSEAGQEKFATALFDGLLAWAQENRPAASAAASASPSPSATSAR